MTRRQRTLIAIPFVLAWAAYGYVRDPYLPGDMTAHECPFDADNAQFVDPTATIRRFDGRRMIITGSLIGIAVAGTTRRDFRISQYAIISKDLNFGKDLVPFPEVAMRAGWLPPYTRSRLRVAGRLHVGVERNDYGQTTAVYTIDVDWVELPDGHPVSQWPLVVVGSIAMVPVGVGLVGLVRRRRRVAAGRCVACGYDLRATPGRCPECGRAAVTAGSSTTASLAESSPA